MARISLFDNINKNAFELALLSAEDVLASISPEQQDPNAEIEEDEVELVIRHTDDSIDENSELAEIALRTAATLEDTAYVIAPTITEARASDVALIRQIASTSAANLGMSDEDMFQANDQLAEGHAIVLEGFKERAAQALYAVWIIIANIAEALFKFFKMLFKNLMYAYNKIHDIADDVKDGKRKLKQIEKPTDNMLAMFPNAKSANAYVMGVHIGQLAQMAVSSSDFLSDIAILNGELEKLTDISSLDAILVKYLEAIRISLKRFDAPESAGKRIVVKGIDAVVKESDPIKACELVKQITIELADVSSGDITDPNIFKNEKDLETGLTGYLGVFYKVPPTYHSEVEMLANTLERTAKLVGMKIKSKWGDILDRMPEADRETIRPYIAAVSEMARQGMTISTKILRLSVRQYAEAVFAAAKYFDAVTEKAN